jgi:RimJ/RimL family protein N-acetyltransferase
MESFNYIREDKILLPYLPGKIDFKEDVLVDIYNKLKEQNLYNVVFHDNSKMTFNQFISFMSSPNIAVAFFCINENGIELPVGICWLTDINTSENKIKRANGSFVFFTEYQSPRYTTSFGKMALSFWFEQLNVDVVTGLTPSMNRSALIYIKRIGFKELGRLPRYTILSGDICDGVITYMSKDMFLGKEN